MLTACARSLTASRGKSLASDEGTYPGGNAADIDVMGTAARAAGLEQGETARRARQCCGTLAMMS